MNNQNPEWEKFLAMCGDTLRPDATGGNSPRRQVLDRTYALGTAAQQLQLRHTALEGAFAAGVLDGFMDPEGNLRIPAQTIHQIANEEHLREMVASYETIDSLDLAEIVGIEAKELRHQLQQLGAHRYRPEWGNIRGHLGLPYTFEEFQKLERQLSDNRKAEQKAKRNAKKVAQKQREDERRRLRQEIQNRLLAAFPEWSHEDRKEQRMVLHVGPPNSGKTYDALQALINAGAGWYLAPLRLLAFEVFDRLNKQGIFCNLLTGEERIDIPGATITAATIEMFSTNNSGDCIIIDEAQMLADPDRGWAWTRAMMEAECPEIHVIAPVTARQLIEDMTKAADLPIEIIEHQRLTPIQVAPKAWNLRQLPPNTILVAFSRRRVLALKAELERFGRKVSVVYGALPPEVRRRQSERFAKGDTEICIATDAVGMGLNLPARQVCFYEIEKFDGRTLRALTAGEVQQIGGRAGRYGLMEDGIVGATTRHNLTYIRKMFYQELEPLTHAHVAPTVEDLEIIPGSLSQRFITWMELRSIPKKLRNVVRTADLEERIQLSGMLTDDEVNRLGLTQAVKLVNAPTRESSRWYWYDCAQAIIQQKPMPLPPTPPYFIGNTHDLEDIEASINYADIYLWLSQREEFSHLAFHEDAIREDRIEWSNRIDNALMQQLEDTKECSRCGRVMPQNFPFKICNKCYHGGANGHATPIDE